MLTVNRSLIYIVQLSSFFVHGARKKMDQEGVHVHKNYNSLYFA
jgi:hypothetical protein